MIFVNFKTYKEGTGSHAIGLARILEKVSDNYSVKIIPVVQVADVREVAAATRLPVWVQSVDSDEYGAHTGSVLPEAVYEDGARGTFLNHSEHKFSDFETLEKTVKRAKSVGLETLLFAASVDELRGVVSLDPTFVSYEPPELVGSRTTSVAQAKPKVISEAVAVAKDREIPLIVGAGIKSRQDVKTSLKLGAYGIALASAIVTAQDPETELIELAQGFKEAKKK